MAKNRYPSYEDDFEDDFFERDWFGRKRSAGFTTTNERSRVVGRWTDKFSTMSEAVFGDFSYGSKKRSPIGSIMSVAKTMLKMVGVKQTKDGSFNFVSTERAAHSEGGSTVVLPTHLIMDKEKSADKKDIVYDLNPKKTDAFLGGTLEKASMKAYQTHSEYLKTIKDLDPEIKGFGAESYLRGVLNVERTNKALSDEFPGYARFIGNYKNYIYEENYQPEQIDSDDIGAQLLDVATRMIKFPTSITEEEFEKHSEAISEFKKVFTKYGNELPATYEEASEMASEVAKYIKLKEQENKEDQENGEGQGDGDGDGSDKAAAAKARQLGHGDSGLEDQETKALMDDMNDAEKESKEEEAEKNFSYDENAVNADSNVVFHDVKDDKYAYNLVLDKIDLCRAAALRNLFKRKSRDQRFVLKAMKSGRFDTNKLAEAKQHVPNVYERVGEIKTDKICVGLLIDESGSMGGSSIRMAQQAAIMLNEVFGKQPDVEFFVYGHTADWSKTYATDILVYREPGKMMHKFALGSVSSKSNNRDGHAILAVGQRIRKFTKNPGILIVLSDGAPAAYNYNNGVKDTKEKVTKVEKMGFQVIQIAINSYVPSDEMFTHHVVMDDIQSLPRNLTSYMSKKVNTIIKEHVTL